MIPNAASNAGSRTVPILPVVPAGRAAHPAAGLTLAPGPRAVPAARVPEQVRPAGTAGAPPSASSLPAAPTRATPPPSSSVNAYFDWFQSCRCGHSSAWHGGAFGAAWRSGQQVQGACEASDSDGTTAPCPCRHFASAR